ncbi:ketopantoate reductase family protein [Siccirubricoccus sp. G192]|uniref:ketopantoate reductase family protein n=1 Tax=Siccirubricoccus sp. G192 TaxID=2849651 RepID=UPI001C2CAF5D|nr:2-dehydropantoate 2-reductase [Siccirubricoccus sp. G192]MBV1799390.1 2-dehydropantoate 2-reductase [Siccirubricoccus sp. G192]
MKICVYGPGAIGGHLAGRLAKGGAELSVVARGAQLAAIRERGLTVRAADGEMHSRPRASDNPAELGPQDAVVVCTKVPALPGVAAAIAPLLGPNTAVAFVTNGIPWWYFDRHGGTMDGARIPEVDPGDAVRNAVGVQRVLGGVIYSACSVAEPGVIEVSSRTSKLVLGEPDNSRSERAVALATAFKSGGLPCSVSGDIRTEVWGKLLNNLANGPICLLTRRNIRDTFAEPVLREAARQVVEEGLAIAAAMGRPVPTTAEDRINLSVNIPHKPSILQDLEMGRPMEIDALFQVPLRLARECGVPTPVLSLTVALAVQAAIAAGLHYPSGKKAGS